MATPADTSAAPNVLFFTDNGHGLGHLTRLMAVAKEARGRFNPVFLTMSEAFPLLRRAGFPAEYFPSYKKLQLSKAEWDPLFLSRMGEMIRTVRPRAVVVDHIGPSRTFGTLRTGATGIDFIWSRRGLWRSGRNSHGIAMGANFDLVVEPGDIASPIDIGLTALDRATVQPISPVVIANRAEELDREQARRELDIPAEGRAILIQLSDSDPERVGEHISRARSVVEKHTSSTMTHFFSPLHPLHQRSRPRVPGVRMEPVYPIAHYLNAFDGVISTAGYNSYHEIIASGLPAVFVARETDALDDQGRRARFAEFCGRGFWAPSIKHERFEEAVERMLDVEEAEIARGTAAELGEMTGAREFSDLIAVRCADVMSHRFSAPPPEPDGDAVARALRKLRSGKIEPADQPAGIHLVLAIEAGESELQSAAERIARSQRARPVLKPVFVLRDAQPDALAPWGFAFERIMTEKEWDGLVTHQPYRHYPDARIEEALTRYRPIQVSDTSQLI